MSQEKTNCREIEKPCRNFNILASTVINDPWDGREKLVLSNFAAGGTGTLIFIDTHTGEGDSFLLPGDHGAWGLVNWRDEKLVIGTCPEHAYLHCFDLKSRTWAEPLSDPGEKYFWDMVEGADGMIYGGTWPGCSLLRYDPVAHTLVNLGRASENPKNLYSRYFHSGHPDYLLLSGGYDEPFMKAFHYESGTFRDFGIPGYAVREVNDAFIALEKGEELAFYDCRTLARMEDEAQLVEKLAPRDILLSNGKRNRVLRLSGGRLAGVRGQDYFIIDHPGQEPVLQRIPVEAPPTAIHSLITDQGGVLWGSCGFGQTIFRFDPSNGEYWNSSSVCDAGGEVYGLQFAGGRLFMSAYVGGDHIVYDPAAQWDQLNNVNPKTLKSVRPDFIRPEGRMVTGPDGGLWTGWSAKYGTYGGALSRIDPVTLKVDVWPHPIPEQQVAGVAADMTYVYLTTNGGASGLAFKHEPCHFAVWSPPGGLVYRHRFEEEEGATGNAILALGRRVYVGVGTDIRIFDPHRLEFVGSLAAGAPCSWMVALNERTLGAFCGSRLVQVDVQRGEIQGVEKLPGTVRAAAVTPSGDLFFAVESVLYRWTPAMAPSQL